jgi:cytochrome c
MTTMNSLTTSCDASHDDSRATRSGKAWPSSFDVGRIATDAEIRAWDIDVSPDGTGLPQGRGTAKVGEAVYSEKCASCHGMNGEGGPADRLVGRDPRSGFLFGQSLSFLEKKSIGNYWPYATTLFDYTNRAMPQNAPRSLTGDEVYSLVAYLLYKNEIVAEDFVVDALTLPAIAMPAANRFVPDSRCGGPEIR